MQLKNTYSKNCKLADLNCGPDLTFHLRDITRRKIVQFIYILTYCEIFVYLVINLQKCCLLRLISTDSILLFSFGALLTAMYTFIATCPLSLLYTLSLLYLYYLLYLYFISTILCGALSTAPYKFKLARPLSQYSYIYMSHMINILISKMLFN